MSETAAEPPDRRAALFDDETGREGKAARDKRRGVNQPTALYRLYDADDVALYVGSSKNPARRWLEHKGKFWWPRVARREVTWFDGRPDALLAEHRAIVAEHPLHNDPHDPQGLLPGVKRDPSKCRHCAILLGVEWPPVATPGMSELERARALHSAELDYAAKLRNAASRHADRMNAERDRYSAELEAVDKAHQEIVAAIPTATI